MAETDDVQIRPTRDGDHEPVLELIRPFVNQQKVLPRTIDELNELWATSFVAEADSDIVGFVVLDIYSRKLAEVRSLVVSQAYQGRGIGRRLVQACVDLARERDVLEVMAISSSEVFFRSCGFDYTLPGEKKAFFLQIHPWR